MPFEVIDRHDYILAKKRRIIFLFLTFAILPNVIYLEYSGGKLVFGSAHRQVQAQKKERS
jgi:hypothetical protein